MDDEEIAAMRRRLGEFVHVTRKEMLQVRAIFDAGKTGKGSAIYRGQRIVGYREWVGDWPAVWQVLVILADGTRLNLSEM